MPDKNYFSNRSYSFMILCSKIKKAEKNLNSEQYYETKYNELKEIGKTNRTFNYLIKDDKILIKFFKRKKTNIEYIKINQCNDISHFNNNTLVQNIIDGINYF